MNELKDSLFRKAKNNIRDAQLRQKQDYDRKHAIGKRKVHQYALINFFLVLDNIVFHVTILKLCRI